MKLISQQLSRDTITEYFFIQYRNKLNCWTSLEKQMIIHCLLTIHPAVLKSHSLH